MSNTGPTKFGCGESLLTDHTRSSAFGFRTVMVRIGRLPPARIVASGRGTQGGLVLLKAILPIVSVDTIGGSTLARIIHNAIQTN